MKGDFYICNRRVECGDESLKKLSFKIGFSEDATLKGTIIQADQCE